MKIEQFRYQATTEQLNDRLAKVFGSSIKLDQFTDEQLESAQSSIINKISDIEQSESFDGLSHNEAEEIKPEWAYSSTNVLLHSAIASAS